MPVRRRTSLTLPAATIGGWKLNVIVVDVVIGLSLVYVGAQGSNGGLRA